MPRDQSIQVARRQLIFDIEKLNRMKSKYNLEPEIKVTKTKTESDESDESLVGLDRHLTNDNDNDKTVNNNNKTVNNNNIPSEKSEDTNHDVPVKDSLDENNPTQATQATQAIKHKHKFYFLNGLGKYHCKNCKTSGDRFYMEETYCKGSKK